MATISENLQALNQAKQSIKSAIESKGQDLTNVPFTQYGEKISAISGGGTGQFVTIDKEITNNGTYNASDDNADGYKRVIVNTPIASGDLLDVTELPTENVDESKVYRTTELGAILYFSDGEGHGVPFIAPNEYVSSIDLVTNPIISPLDNDFVYVYLDTSTYIGYMWVDADTRITMAEFFSMAGYGDVTNNGGVYDVSDMTQFGVYFLLSDELIIGIPEKILVKKIYEYDGTQWQQHHSITSDMLVGLWKRETALDGTYFYEFKPNGDVIYKDEQGGREDSYWIEDYTYFITNGLLTMRDARDGGFAEYKYVVSDGIPTLVSTIDNSVAFTRVIEFPISTT